MAGRDSSRLFFSHRRIVGDESPHRRRRRGEVNADPPTHAVADYADARAVPCPSCPLETISPHPTNRLSSRTKVRDLRKISPGVYPELAEGVEMTGEE